jgi:hypothetical protein
MACLPPLDGDLISARGEDDKEFSHTLAVELTGKKLALFPSQLTAGVGRIILQDKQK